MPDFSVKLEIKVWITKPPRNASPNWKPHWLRPTLMNQVEKSHWGVNSRVTTAWQNATMEAIEDAGIGWMRFDNIRFDFLPAYHRRIGGDTAATCFTEKAIVDGFVKAGVMPDDNGFHNAGQLSLPPVRVTGWTGMVVRATAKDKRDDHPSHLECGCRESMELMQRANDQKAKNRKKRQK